MSKPPIRILVADDDAAVTEGLSAILSDEGYEVAVAHDGKSALKQLLAHDFALLVADVHMPGLDGMALLAALTQHGLSTRCVIMTGAGTVPLAVAAIQNGADNYILKPLNSESLALLKAAVVRSAENFKLVESYNALARQLEGLTHYGDMTGESESMRRVYSMIEAVAPSVASVLVYGESGTGKELVAHALHTRSARASGPFLALNCAALPKDILENELFGHEKGAFTGSVGDKPGAFEMAHGGTLFLDEVAEMPPEIQVKLLRALESRSIRRLGGKREISVDIRVVAATNRDVQSAIADGTMRDDLYYRLAVVEIALPPLRERDGDVRLLATEFLAKFAKANKKKLAGFDDDAWSWILSYTWPGNVRELKNAVERAVILARGDMVTRTDVIPMHFSARSVGRFDLDVGVSLDAARRLLVLRTLALTGGDKARAATLLGTTIAEVDIELNALVNGGGDSADSAGVPAKQARSEAAAGSTPVRKHSAAKAKRAPAHKTKNSARRKS